MRERRWEDQNADQDAMYRGIKGAADNARANFRSSRSGGPPPEICRVDGDGCQDGRAALTRAILTNEEVSPLIIITDEAQRN